MRFDGSGPAPASSCPHRDVAVVTTAFTGTPKIWQVKFVRQHAGKLVCYECGEFVGEEHRDRADHVTATTVTGRLRQLKKI